MDPFTLRLEDAAALAQLRQAVREWLASLEIAEPDVGAIMAACSEIAADAVEVGPAELHGVLAGGDVVVRCLGAACWRVEDHPSRYVAALLVDDVSIDRSENATAVLLRKAASRGLRL